MTCVLDGDVDELNIKSIIGFDGSIIGGLRIHPDGEHVAYPLGNKVIILHWKTKRQTFLTGHTNIISAIDVSRSGKYVASGQINHIGFRALVIIWDFATRKAIGKHEIHKVRVEAVAFSIHDTYLMSLGGRDCSSIVVWEMAANKPLCGAAASKGTQGEATTICVTHRRVQCFVTAGDGTLTVWKVDYEARKLVGIDVNVSKLKRTVLCTEMNDKDEILYCGTSTGDILKIRLNYHHDVERIDPVSTPVMIGCYARYNEKKKTLKDQIDLYPMGVRAIMILGKGILLVGGGDGTINIVEETSLDIKIPHGMKLPSTPQLIVVKSTTVRALITSFNHMEGNTVLVGTLASEIYSIDIRTFELKLLVTCHTSTIYDLAFPHNFSDVFATASKDDVRIWNINTMQELLRIKVQNFCCSSIVFTHDGKSIITAWNDGIIRSFTPLTGRLIYSILNAHNKGVSALALTDDDKMVISGGCEGQVRCWDISPYKQQLICTLKEHKGPVSAININKFNDEAVSASTDGTCIIWDIARKCRKQILFANTLFMCVKYYPSGVQILTCGLDRKIAYWEVLDGTLIREVEGSTSAGLNTLDISPDGSMFVTGGNDQMIKLWLYQEGIVTHLGLGHSAVLSSIRFSPNGKYIVSASASGSIFVWECPFDVSVKQEPEEVKEESVKEEVKEKASKVKTKKQKPEEDEEEHVSDLGTDRQEELKKRMTCKCPEKAKCRCPNKMAAKNG